MNRPTGSTPGPQHEDLGTGTPSTAASPDGRGRRDGRDAETDTESESESESDEAGRPQAGPPSQLPEGYEPL